MNGHWGDIKQNRNKRMAEYFNKSDHTFENLRLVVIKNLKVKQINKEK